MPLFFFISGYLYKPEKNYTKYLYNKSISLLIPYFIFLLMIFSFQYGIDYIYHNPKDSFFLFLWGGTKLVGWTGIFWFITCFFITLQIFNLLYTKCNERLLILINCLSLSLAYVNYIYFQTLSLPWALNLVLYTLPIYSCGYLIKKYENIVFRKRILIIFLSALSTIICLLQPIVSINIKYTNYGVPIISFLLGIILILGVVILSQQISKLTTVTNVLSYTGKASMVIMYLHQFIQLYILQHYTSNILIRFAFALFVPLLIYWIFSKFSTTRLLFLGIKNK